MCSPQQVAFEIYRDVELSVYLDSEKSNSVEGGNEEDLSHLKTKIHEIADENYNESKDCSCEFLDSIISDGTYNPTVISKLLKSGIDKESILKSMKYGLQSLNPAELGYFCTFGVSADTLENKDLSCLDEELTRKLINFGLSNEESLKIIIHGLVDQNDCRLFQLNLNGVAVSKILSWQGPKTCASKQILTFLRVLGFDQTTLSRVAERGITEEVMGLLKSLGYSESIEASLTAEEVLCDSSIRTKTLESCTCSFNQLSNGSSTEESSACSCSREYESQKLKILQKKDFLRENLMAPLTWALSRTLKYNPSNPTHYLACQLVRWKFYLDPLEKNKILDFVIESTRKRDQLMAKSSIN